jgi:hypothetical protein
MITLRILLKYFFTLKKPFLCGKGFFYTEFANAFLNGMI